MADTSVFSRLKRLFSTDVVIRNTGDNQLKVIDVNKIQQSGDVATNSLIDRFGRIYTAYNTNSTSLYGSQLNINFQYLRAQLYSDYDAMDSDAIIASALDIISDECTLKNDMDEILQIKSSNEDIQKTLYNLFYDVLNIEFNLWSWTRQMCKYGDFFLKLEIAEKYGVYNIIPYTAYHIERQENYDDKNPTAVRFRYSPMGMQNPSSGYFGMQSSANSSHNDKTSIYFDNYEMAHFRLLTDVNYLPYGRSYIEPARKLFKQYTLMEDAMLIHRIVRAPEKRVFFVNVGAIPPNEVENFMQKTISSMKRTPFLDPESGEYNLKYNMQNMLEDFFIPVRGNDVSTKIETTKGLDYTGMEDVIYLRDKLFAALKVPKAFMGYEKDLTGKATLAAEDIRFARTIDRIQRILVSELYKIALIHLYVQGYDNESLTNFELKLTTPSIIYEQERIALAKEKIALAKDMTDSGLFPSDFIYDNIYHLSEDQYDEYRDLIREDKKRIFRLKQIEQEGNDPLESGKSYGTPHDLAALYGRGRYKANSDNVPSGYDENNPAGRPEERDSDINTQDNAFGKDRLGKHDMKVDDTEGPGLRPNYKGNSPLASESAKVNYLKNKTILENLDKKMVFESDKKKVSLLDENQIKE
jgi:hypothetical protein